MTLDCKKPKNCAPPEPPKPHDPTPPFEVCIALDYKLVWDGTHATLERVTTTPDGTYTLFNVVNGCIVNPGVGDVPTYTPPYCNPNPADCQQGNGSVNISHQSGNTIINYGDGLYARTYVQAGANIVVTGVGTAQDPYVVSGGAGGGGIVNVVGEGGINARVENNVAFVGLAPTGVTPGVYNGFTINKLGQVTATDSALEGASVGAGRGLASHNEGDKLIIEHPAQNIPASFTAGGWRMDWNDSGHLQAAAQTATPVPNGCYIIGGTEVCVIDGVIERIGDGGGGGNGGGGSGGYGGIRDMYRITVNTETYQTGPWVETYGRNLHMTHQGSGSLTIDLPGYVHDISQVDVNVHHGNIRKSINAEGKLELSYTPPSASSDQIVTVVLRG